MTAGESFGLGLMLVNGHAACFWPFMRHSFGVMALWPGGLIAIILMLLYAGIGHCPEMRFFFLAWLGLVLFHRGCTLVKLARGWREHSRYDGWPWLAMRLLWPRPRDEIAAKFVGEPMLALIAGAGLCAWSVPLGLFVMSGFLSLAVSTGIQQQIEIAHDRAMNDAEIVMRQRAARRRRGSF